MKILRIIGIGLLLLAPLPAGAQPAYKCLDLEGRLVLTQGEPPAGLRCSEEPGLRPAPPSQRPETVQPVQPAVDYRWTGAVKTCSEQARWLDRGFDAYAPRSGQVEMLGTTQARYAFSKCLAGLGLKTSDVR